MEQISVGSATTLANVERWLDRPAPDVQIRLGRESRLLPFAEGPATNVIAALKQNTRIHVVTKFKIDFAQDLSDLGCLETPFGLQLLYNSTDVTDVRGLDCRTALLEAVWKKVLQKGGLLGSGDAQYIFFRDPDYVDPQCLRGARGGRSVLPARQFNWVLKQAATALGAGKGFGDSNVEEHLLTFLYEATANANEHGAAAATGFRGIAVRKIIFHREEELTQRDLPQSLLEYASRSWVSRVEPLVLISFTISDLGRGIQSTLAPIAGESERSRFLRAFLPGESCKPKGSDIARGQGLGKILYAASALKALIVLNSSSLLAYKDCSLADDGTGDLLTIHPRNLLVPAGTSITMLWAPPRISPDQQALPFGS